MHAYVPNRAAYCMYLQSIYLLFVIVVGFAWYKCDFCVTVFAYRKHIVELFREIEKESLPLRNDVI